MIPISDDISLYFHIPFCTRKCSYCHFFVLPDREADKQLLHEGFQREWQRRLPDLYPGRHQNVNLEHSDAGQGINKKEVATVYFGGGTPSLFGPSRIASLMELIRQTTTLAPTAEITLEANPENITLELMRAYAEAGINRVSIGIQTLDADLLQLLGRQHSPTTALKAIETVEQAGIGNISIDLMYDLPQQGVKHWKETLNAIKRLPITHLSLYNLTIEPHTVFFKKQAELCPLLPDQDTSLAMYEMAIEALEEQGLQQYEISAFANPGHESKHNTGYWTGREFFGLGPSAFSYWQGRRFRNIAHLGKYCRALTDHCSPVDFEELLDPDARRRELFVVQLRLLQGVDYQHFRKIYGPLDDACLAAMTQLLGEGLLSQSENQITLSKKGILFYDTVASELI